MKREEYVGFYSLNKTIDEHGYLGALLVTDQYGRPLEFRVTYPVKPSAFQRPLYGDALEPFIGVELCGKQLLKHLDHTLDLLTVGAEFLLDVRDFVPCPVVHVQKAGDAIEIQANGRGEQGWARQQIASPSGRFQPIVIRTAHEREDDLDRARSLVEETFTHMDLLEPFERITQALELLARGDSRFA
ncbi:MAG: hypothetical protein H8D43_05120 [Chloroflexi bacterium]|nr:hypothetical protein [Chloroflexota bacterium]